MNYLYKYDVLRADRCISAHGLELRVPFLDNDFVNLILKIPTELKIPTNGYEKYLLRKSFEELLPQEILWRRKDGMSDGVSSVKNPWYRSIREMIDTRFGDEMFDPLTYMSKESMYYRLIFNAKCPGYNLKLPPWLPKWSYSMDPSGRKISIPDPAHGNKMIKAYAEPESPEEPEEPEEPEGRRREKRITERTEGSEEEFK